MNHRERARIPDWWLTNLQYCRKLWDSSLCEISREGIDQTSPVDDERVLPVRALTHPGALSILKLWKDINMPAIVVPRYDRANRGPRATAKTRNGARGPDNSDCSGGGMIEIKHKKSGEVLRCVDAKNLEEADLGGANLREADLSNVSLSGAQYDHDTRWPAGFDPQECDAVLVKG